MVDVVVDEGGEEVAGGADGVHVAGEVEVDVFHGDDLRVAAARRAAFDAKDGAERGFAQGDDGVFAQTTQAVGETDGNGGFAFAGGGGVDGGDEDEFAGLACGGKFAEIDFGFVVAVGDERFRRDAKRGGDVGNGTDGGSAGNGGVGRLAHV